MFCSPIAPRSSSFWKGREARQITAVLCLCRCMLVCVCVCVCFTLSLLQSLYFFLATANSFHIYFLTPSSSWAMFFIPIKKRQCCFVCRVLLLCFASSASFKHIQPALAPLIWVYLFWVQLAWLGWPAHLHQLGMIVPRWEGAASLTFVQTPCPSRCDPRTEAAGRCHSPYLSLSLSSFVFASTES